MPQGFLSQTKRCWTPHSTPARELRRAVAQRPPSEHLHGGLGADGEAVKHTIFLSTWKADKRHRGGKPGESQGSRQGLQKL